MNNLFIDTVPVTVTYLVSNYKNDYEEEQESDWKETVRHFPSVFPVFMWRCENYGAQLRALEYDQ